MHARLAEDRDVVVVGALAREAHEEGRYGRYALNEEKVYAMFHGALRGEDLVCIVAEDAGIVLGFIAGIITQHYFADMTYATNIALFVSPQARGSRAAYVLIRQFERVARARGAAEIFLGTTSGVNAQRTEKLYNALGFETLGASTVKYIGE